MRPFLLFVLASYARVSDGKDIVAEEVRTSIVGNDDLRCAIGESNRIIPSDEYYYCSRTSFSSTSLFRFISPRNWLVDRRSAGG